MDRLKLETVVRYCRTARCRTRLILEYFGEEPHEELRCGHCDNDLAPREESSARAYSPTSEPESTVADAIGPLDSGAAGLDPGEEVAHETFGRGIVLEVTSDRAEVDFGGHGVRVVRTDFLQRC